MNWQALGISFFVFAIIVEQAHVVSPILLAWLHPGLRQIARSRPITTMLLPIVAIAGALAAPFMVIWWVYWAWNIYHFGAQHYGISRILGYRVPKWVCVGVTAAIMAVGPLLIHAGWWRWFILIAIDFNHWLIDIGLSSRVIRHWAPFLVILAVLGSIGLLWLVPRSDHIATRSIPWIIKARWGVGIAHFLYSRWVWKFSDPRVRATIGKDLFACAIR